MNTGYEQILRIETRKLIRDQSKNTPIHYQSQVFPSTSDLTDKYTIHTLKDTWNHFNFLGQVTQSHYEVFHFNTEKYLNNSLSANQILLIILSYSNQCKEWEMALGNTLNYTKKPTPRPFLCFN